jgi:hypothetical protein
MGVQFLDLGEHAHPRMVRRGGVGVHAVRGLYQNWMTRLRTDTQAALRGRKDPRIENLGPLAEKGVAFSCRAAKEQRKSVSAR